MSIYENLRFYTKFRKGNLTPVKFSFSTNFDNLRRSPFRERDWKQGGIPAGWRFWRQPKYNPLAPCWKDTDYPGQRPKTPVFGPAARRGQLKFRRGPGCPFQRALPGRSPQAAKFLPAAAAAGEADRTAWRELARRSDLRGAKPQGVLSADSGGIAPTPRREARRRRPRIYVNKYEGTYLS